MKTIDLLDYKAIISYNKDKHYPLMLTLHDKDMTKELYVGQHVTIEQLCYQLHLQLLEYKDCYLNPVKTLLMVEEVRDVLDLWLYSEGEGASYERNRIC